MPKSKIPARFFGNYFCESYIEMYEYTEMINYKGIGPEIWSKMEKISGQKMGETPRHRIDDTLIGYCSGKERCDNGIGDMENKAMCEFMCNQGV